MNSTDPCRATKLLLTPSNSFGPPLSITMSSSYPYPSPLAGYENAPPLPTGFNEDGKSLVNTPGPKSKAYDEFLAPIRPEKNGFDFHSWSAAKFVDLTANVVG